MWVEGSGLGGRRLDGERGQGEVSGRCGERVRVMWENVGWAEGSG